MAQNLASSFSQRATNASGVPDFNSICLANPDLALCAYVPNFYSYRIDLAANAVFLSLFSLSFLAYAITYAVTRRSLAFSIAILLGLTCEILGYVGRVLSWNNQWQATGFLIQICCLTIGPAFLSAGTYLCLRRIVYTFGPENSRIAPEWYTRVVSALGRLDALIRPHIGRRSDNSCSLSPAMSSLSFCRLLAAPWPLLPLIITSLSKQVTIS